MNHLTSETAKDLPPTKAVIDALVASVRPWQEYPLWALQPRCEAEFLASLVLHAARGDIDAPGLRIGYDDNDRAALVYGVRYKAGALAGLALTGVPA